jgi:hypothetical protein
MIIEIPLLSLISLWLWNTFYIQGIRPKELVSASSTYTILCYFINLIWLFFYYPKINLKIDNYFYLFSMLFSYVILLIFKRCATELKIYFIAVIVTYILIRALIVFTDNIKYLLCITLFEIGIPYLWLIALKKYVKHRST